MTLPASDVEKWMTTELLTASPQEMVLNACRQMCSRHTGSIIVLEEGKLAGIFTERDALDKVIVGERDPKTTPIGTVMTRNPQTARTGDNVLETYDRMLSEGFRHMPVVDRDGRLVGMLSIKDLNKVTLPTP